jgi:hypothetical protein
MPHQEELAMLIVGDLSLENYKRDIIVSTHQNSLQRISIFHPAYMPLQYPLLFPYGERGFQLGIKYHGQNINQNIDDSKRDRVTLHEFLKYHVHCWGLVLKCYELRTRQHKMLNDNILRPTKHYSLED